MLPRDLDHATASILEPGAPPEVNEVVLSAWSLSPHYLGADRSGPVMLAPAVPAFWHIPHRGIGPRAPGRMEGTVTLTMPREGHSLVIGGTEPGGTAKEEGSLPSGSCHRQIARRIRGEDRELAALSQVSQYMQTKHQLRGATAPLACSRPVQPDGTRRGEMPVAMGYAWDVTGAPGLLVHDSMTSP